MFFDAELLAVAVALATSEKKNEKKKKPLKDVVVGLRFMVCLVSCPYNYDLKDVVFLLFFQTVLVLLHCFKK